MKLHISVTGSDRRQSFLRARYRLWHYYSPYLPFTQPRHRPLRAFRFARDAGKAGGAGGRRALLPEREVSSQLLTPLRRRRRQNRKNRKTERPCCPLNIYKKTATMA